MMKVSVLGIDLGKNICSIVGLDAIWCGGFAPASQKKDIDRLGRKTARPCIVAHGSLLRRSSSRPSDSRTQGHDVRLMSPEYVRPYIKAQKNDDRDAEGIAEAATRPTMRFVELKTQEQLDMQTLHRSRDRLVA